MATRTRRPERRENPLSRERIVEAAVELLDADGEGKLTFRALAERLTTGPGAIYWHVANKGELLDAATDAVVADALAVAPVAPVAPATSARSVAPTASATSTTTANSPRDGIRTVALALFDAIDAHPWLATQLAAQLSRTPGQSVAPRIFESIGRQVSALEAPERSWFTVTSALVHYTLGAAGQNAANGRTLGPGADRSEFLDTTARAWEALDSDDYPFTRAVAVQIRDHDDREQFLAGIDLILNGVAATPS
ncbi:TetR/AcrR family transcriptional regulator [Streptomyces sp. KL118A]|uniref:TetR/AcrR family transcriptional regulator n=1 Tax=Streptomyces sp. KL118A TaxID=3045153 RepID=UPI00278BD919|nr:TetR family transcriptional regulator [Streptomyces sp. KL118A]